MTDDLVKRLRQPTGLNAVTQEPVQDKLNIAAAERIEELEAKLKTAEEIGRAFEEDAGQLRAKLAKAEWLLVDATVQLEEGKIKTRRNRAALIRQFLAELTGGKDE